MQQIGSITVQNSVNHHPTNQTKVVNFAMSTEKNLKNKMIKSDYSSKKPNYGKVDAKEWTMNEEKQLMVRRKLKIKKIDL